MEIGIIGSGNIGTALARRWVALGHRVLMANSRGPDSLTDRAAEVGIIPATVRQAARAADIVLIAIPLRAVADLPADLFAGAPAASLVLDANNYYPDLRDGRIADIDAGLTDSEWVARTLGRPVLKVFNSIHAPTIVTGGRPAGDPARICLPVAGDDRAAVARVVALLDALGFDGLDAGPLADSWRQQPGTPVYCRDLPLEAARAALAQPAPGSQAANRQAAMDNARRYVTNPGKL